MRERLIEAAAEWTSNYCAEAILAAVLPLIAQALDDERADSDEPAWHVDPEINSAWQWGMRRAAALVRSWAADGAR